MVQGHAILTEFCKKTYTNEEPTTQFDHLFDPENWMI